MIKRHIKKIAIFSTLFAIAFGGAFFSQYKKPVEKTSNTAKPQFQQVQTGPLTDKQKLLNSLLEIKAFELNVNVDMFTTDNNHVSLTIDGAGDVSDLEDIKIDGDITVGLNGSELNANLGYFGGEIFFDFNESYFRLETESLLDFVKMLPTEYGMELSIPTEIEELDLGMVESFVNDMSEKETTPDGNSYFFVLPLSEKISLKILTDLDCNFTGISVDTIDYNGMLFSGNVKLNKVDSLTLTNPKEDMELYRKYQDFRPAFTLFDAIYSLTKERQNTINADLSVYKTVDDVEKALINTNLDITYDLLSEKHAYSLDGTVSTDFNDSSKKRSVAYNFALANETIYAAYGDVALSVKTNSLSLLLDYVLERIGDEKIGELVDSMMTSMSSEQVVELAEKAGDLLGRIVLTEDQLGINLNTSIFSTQGKLELGDMYIALNFDNYNKKLTTLEIRNVTINNYRGDLVLTFGEYKPFAIIESNYQSLDCLLPSVGFYDLYKDQTKFRLEFDAKVSKEGQEDINVDGGLQFELDPQRKEEGHSNVGYGYGLVTIEDRKDVKHNIYVDMKNVDEVLMSYSTVIGETDRDNNTDPLYAKMKVKTVTDIAEIGMDIIKNPDEHFYEIINSLIGDLTKMPIYDALYNKNYTTLLTTNIINSFEVGADYIEMNVSLDVLAFEDTNFTVRIEFDLTNPETYGLRALKIKDLNFKGLGIEFNAYLKQFKPELETGRLSPANYYIDFSDIKVLLQLGINTSKNNYYHLKTTKCDIKFTILDLPINPVIDLKIRTDHGDVTISADIDVPSVILINDEHSPKNRKAHIYYHDGFVYVHRTDEQTIYTTQGGLIPFWRDFNVEHVGKYTVKDFGDNIMKILCEDVFVLRSWILNRVNNSMNENSAKNHKMKYENILNDFVYSESGHYFFFDVNLAEIANNSQMKKFTVKVLTDESNTQLKGINPYLEIGLLGSIGLTVDIALTLEDASIELTEANRLVAAEAFETRMAAYASGYNVTTETLK